MPTFDGAEGKVFYRRWPPQGGARRIAVLVHGYAEHSGRYAHLAQALASSGAAVFAEDHIGHGRSDGERAVIGDFERVVDDLTTLTGIATTEFPSLGVVMFGHSMGGLLASRYAMRHPGELAGLVLAGAVIGDWHWARCVLEEQAMPDPPETWDGMSRDPEAVAAYTSDPLVYRGPYKRALLEAEVTALDRFNSEIDRITIPILFLHGTDDPFVPYQTSLEAARRLPTDDLTVRLYEGARHELVNETNRVEVIAEIVAFAERVAPGVSRR